MVAANWTAENLALNTSQTDLWQRESRFVLSGIQIFGDTSQELEPTETLEVWFATGFRLQNLFPHQNKPQRLSHTLSSVSSTKLQRCYQKRYLLNVKIVKVKLDRKYHSSTVINHLWEPMATPSFTSPQNSVLQPSILADRTSTKPNKQTNKDQGNLIPTG